MKDVLKRRVKSDVFSDAVVRGLEPHAARLDGLFDFSHDSRDLRLKKQEGAGVYLGRLFHSTVGVTWSMHGSRLNEAGELTIVAFPPLEGTGRRDSGVTLANGSQFSDGQVPFTRRWGGGGVVAEAVLSLFSLSLDEEDSNPVMHALHLGKTTIQVGTDNIINAATVGQSRELFEASMTGAVTAEPTATLTVLEPRRARPVLLEQYDPSAMPDGLTRHHALFNAQPGILQVAAILAVREGTGSAQQEMIPRVGATMPLAFE